MADYPRGATRDDVAALPRFQRFSRIPLYIARLYSAARYRMIPTLFGFNGGWN